MSNTHCCIVRQMITMQNYLASKCMMTLYSDGRYREAEQLDVQVMGTRKTKLGADHPDTLNSIHNLAFTLQSQACHAEALALIEKCFQSRQQVLGEQHPDPLSSFDTLSGWRAECSNRNS